MTESTPTLTTGVDSDTAGGHELSSFRETWAAARRLYAANRNLFEDELDARAALGLGLFPS